MIKLIIFFILFAINLVHSEEIEIQSGSLYKTGDSIGINNGMLLFKEDYFAKANNGLYNEKTGDLELFGDVFIINKSQTSLSSYAKINFQDKCGTFKDFFISSSFMEFWLKSSESYYLNNEFIVKKSSISSCDVENPDWKITFYEGRYNSETKDLKLKHMVFYYKNVPLIYLPYFSINTDDTRKTGFLSPKMAIKSKEAFYYEQPFFWAINHRMDLEIRPQIRTNRGYGIYSKYRFVDSPDSYGEISGGIFKEYNKYFIQEELRNNKHYGYNIFYTRDKVFNTNDNYQEGLFIDYKDLNDIDFLNLSTFYNHSDDYLITSKLNYFLTNNKDYFGLYLKYYKDTSIDSQRNIIHELPTIHYHRFYDTLFELLNYKIDTNYSYFYRQSGSTLHKVNINAPIIFQKSFFNNYLNFIAQEEIDFTFTSFVNSNQKDAYYFNTTHTAGIYTNLYNKYDKYLHNVDFGIKANLKTQPIVEENDFFLTTQEDKYSINFEFSQTLFNNENKKLKHYLLIRSIDKKIDLIDNQIEYFIFDNFSLNNTLQYSIERKSIERFFMQSFFWYKRFYFDTGFFFNRREDIVGDARKIERFLSAKLSYDITRNNTIYAQAWYNLKTNNFNNYTIGFIHKKRCINYTLEYSEKTTSKLTHKGVESSKDRGFYLRFNLYPIGGVKYNVSLRGESDDF